MDEVEAHLDETYLAWMGSTGDGPFYYRVHSPVILIEFDHHPGVVFTTRSRHATTCTQWCAHRTPAITASIYYASTTSISITPTAHTSRATDCSPQVGGRPATHPPDMLQAAPPESEAYVSGFRCRMKRSRPARAASRSTAVVRSSTGCFTLKNATLLRVDRTPG